MIIKLVFSVVFIGLIVLLVIGFEIYQLRKLKISDKDLNNCFKDVDKWKS